MAAGIRAGKGPISSSNGHTTQRPFGGVVGETDAAIVEEARERRPAVEQVVDGLGGVVAFGGRRISIIELILLGFSSIHDAILIKFTRLARTLCGRHLSALAAL